MNEQELKRKLASAENMAVRQRNYRRARDRALARLAQNYKEEYLELLAEEKEKDEAQGKRWNFHSNSDTDLWTNLSKHLAGKTGGDTSANTQNESNNE